MYVKTAVYWNLMLYSLVERNQSSTLVHFCQRARRHIQEAKDLHIHRHEKLKSDALGVIL
jgi:hypothetical protein